MEMVESSIAAEKQTELRCNVLETREHCTFLRCVWQMDFFQVVRIGKRIMKGG